MGQPLTTCFGTQVKYYNSCNVDDSRILSRKQPRLDNIRTQTWNLTRWSEQQEKMDSNTLQQSKQGKIWHSWVKTYWLCLSFIVTLLVVKLHTEQQEEVGDELKLFFIYFNCYVWLLFKFHWGDSMDKSCCSWARMLQNKNPALFLLPLYFTCVDCCLNMQVIGEVFIYPLTMTKMTSPVTTGETQAVYTVHRARCQIFTHLQITRLSS